MKAYENVENQVLLSTWQLQSIVWIHDSKFVIYDYVTIVQIVYK